MDNDNMISYNDYLRLKALIEKLDSLENLRALTKLIDEIYERKATKKETKINNSKKIELNINPKPVQIYVNNVEKEKKYVFKQIEKMNKFEKFIEDYCEFDSDSSIKTSVLIEKYNTINNENLAPHLVGLIVVELGKTLPIERCQKIDGVHYKGIRFKQDKIEL